MIEKLFIFCLVALSVLLYSGKKCSKKCFFTKSGIYFGLSLISLALSFSTIHLLSITTNGILRFLLDVLLAILLSSSIINVINMFYIGKIEKGNK